MGKIKDCIFIAKWLWRNWERKDIIGNNLTEVVRCKDCKYLSEFGHCRKHMYCDSKFVYHPVINPDNESYCSYGERKECK
jgi:hypothetical protein